jgi:AcrR family transcriptional regulator
MRARLLDATIDCLSRLGYSRTTTTEVAERAGVSRGAQLHHFPTKAELVTNAVERLFERRHAEFVHAMAGLPAGADRPAAAIDLLWSMVSGPTFHAWLELTVAARTDPELAPSVRVRTRRFVEAIERTFPELFPPPTTPNPFYELAPMFVFAVVHGLAPSAARRQRGPRAARAVRLEEPRPTRRAADRRVKEKPPRGRPRHPLVRRARASAST